MLKNVLSATVAVGLMWNCTQCAVFAGDAKSSKPGETTTSRSETVIINPKPIGENVTKGLAYLASQQLSDGGWAEGDEAPAMRGSFPNKKDQSNVADTCMAALAFVRSGAYPDSKSPYAKTVEKAAQYVMDAVSRADHETLFVTDIRSTRVQMKLGQFVDTFLSSLFLTELKGRMATPDQNGKLAAAIDKVVYKIQRNQGSDGKWASGGWAPIHSQALASTALNRARQMGVQVDDAVLERAETAAKGSFDRKSGQFSSDGAASVPLYAAGANLGAIQQSITSNAMRKGELRSMLTSRTLPKEKVGWAQSQLNRFKETEEVQKQALASVTQRLGDRQFVQGFGCNGGEEFLSYLQISETLLANKSKEFAQWDKKIGENLAHVQNTDGSWMGQHCITSRTFCTAAAVMVLTADRSPVLKTIASADEQLKSDASVSTKEPAL